MDVLGFDCGPMGTNDGTIGVRDGAIGVWCRAIGEPRDVAAVEKGGPQPWVCFSFRCLSPSTNKFDAKATSKGQDWFKASQGKAVKSWRDRGKGGHTFTHYMTQ